MRGIPAWLLRTTIEHVQALGMALDPLERAAQTPTDGDPDPQGEPPWDVVLDACQEMVDRGLPLQAFVTIGQRTWEHPVLADITRPLRPLYDGRGGYEALLALTILPYLQRLQHRHAVLPDGTIRLDVKLVPGYRDRPVIWAWFEGLLIGLPRALGRPTARVEAEIGDRRARFLIRIPPQKSTWKRLTRRLRTRLGTGHLYEEIVGQQQRLEKNVDKVRAAHEELKRQADAVRQSEIQYRSVIENTADLIVVTDLRGRTLMLSPSLCQMLGIEQDELKDVDIFDTVHAVDRSRIRRVFEQAVRTGSHPLVEFRAVAPGADSPVHWIEVSGRRIHSADGRSQMVIVGRDVSRRKRAELAAEEAKERLESEVEQRTRRLQQVNQELRQIQTRLIDAERTGASQELAGSVAHAINSPLTALIGNLQMLCEAASGTDERLQRMMHLARRIRRVVDQTLQLSREGRLDLALESASEILQEVRTEIEPECARNDIELVVEIEPGLPAVYADRALLRAALEAIARNGIDASRAGDTLRIRAQARPDDRVIEFRFTDSGRGIPESVRGRIFEPFFTTKPAGTGLGLTIAGDIVLGHEGRLSIEPADTGGTEARVEIPFFIANRPVREPPPAWTPEADQLGGTRAELGEKSGMDSPSNARVRRSS